MSGLVYSGVMWCDVLWYGVVLCGEIRYDIAWYGMVWCDVVAGVM